MSAPGPDRVVTTVVPASTPLFSGGGAYDLTQASDVAAELGVTFSSPDEAWVMKAITRLSRAANAFCNRVLVAQLYQEQVWTFRDPYPWQSPTRTHPLQLSNWPIPATASPAGARPPVQPALSAVSGGSLAARTYYARLSYVTATGETAAGIEASVILSADTLAAIAAPPLDKLGLAIGWNAYVGTAAGQETLQNSSPLALSESWTEPADGLTAGAAMPAYVLVVENVNLPFQPDSSLGPTPLAEGKDFVVDFHNGQLTRLFLDGYPRSWPSLPLEIVYTGGFAAPDSTPAFAALPDDIQDALIRWVVARYYARTRDPLLRSENVEGVLARTWALGAGIGAETDLPLDVMAKLERYRDIVIP